MLQLPAGREASRGERVPRYEHHHPEQTLLYQLIEEYYPAFEAPWAAEGRVLSGYGRQKSDGYLIRFQAEALADSRELHYQKQKFIGMKFPGNVQATIG